MTRRAIIFANGDYSRFSLQSLDLQADDLIIAADGGGRYCLSFGLYPHLVVGDFDSLTAEQLDDLKSHKVQLLHFPAHKDETDLELALTAAIQQGVETVWVLGALGARWDMTIANVMLLAHPAFQWLDMRILDGNQELSLLRGGGTTTLHGQPGDTLSLIPLHGAATGITTRGLEYSLDNGTLQAGSPRGVSNQFEQETCQVSLKEGLLLCVLIRQAPDQTNGGSHVSET